MTLPCNSDGCLSRDKRTNYFAEKRQRTLRIMQVFKWEWNKQTVLTKSVVIIANNVWKCDFNNWE